MVRARISTQPTESLSECSAEMPRKRTRSPVAGLNRVRSKGNLYWYHRATGTRLRHDPNSAAGLLEIAAIEARATEALKSQGSLADIIAAYRDPKAGRAGRIRPFRKLSARTQADYQECFDYLADDAGELFPAQMKPRHVQAIVDDAGDAHGWAFGDKLLSVLRLAINWGAYHELTEFKMHPCQGVLAPARDENADDANRPWTDAERVAMFNAAPPEMVILYGLLLYAQLNIKHGLDIPPGAIRTERDASGETHRRLKWKRSKNAEPIDVAIEGPLSLIIDAAPKHGPVLALNSRGDPMTYSGAKSAHRRLVAELIEAGKIEPGLTFHGLRSTLGAIAAEGGANDKDIAAAIHDGTSEMGALYSRAANTRKLAERARKPLIERDEALISGILTSRLQNQMQNSAKVVSIGRQKAK